MSLVSGYDSDSESDVEVSSSTPGRGLSSLLPPALNLNGQAVSAPSLKLPAPLASSSSSDASGSARITKRKSEKRQIKIDALDSVHGGHDEEITPKKPKVGTNGSNGRSGLTGLMGMLPAPKERPPPEAKEVEKNESNNMGLSDSSIGRMEIQQGDANGKRVKGNNDFRAMLGLKPSNMVLKSKRDETVEDGAKSTAAFPAFTEQASPKPMKQTLRNFFSTDVAEGANSKNGSEAGFTVSSAPQVDDETGSHQTLPTIQSVAIDEDQYKGWQQGPDGNWFPVTPEAHAAYSEYLSSQGAQAETQQFSDRPADMQFDEGTLVRSVDANASRQAWLSRPSTEVDPSSSGLDRKYAMAAASLATPDQGIPLIDQEEEVKKMDKKTNFRARRKGQLSALIAQAEENREKLEERWSRGKDGRHAAKEKYGF